MTTKASRLNALSYAVSMLLAAPAFILGTALTNAYSDGTETGFNVSPLSMPVSLILAAIIVRWTVLRLHDVNRAGWWAFALIPPFTLPLLLYLLMPGHPEANRYGETPHASSILGIPPRGFWRIAAIVLLAIFLLYLAGLFGTFLFDDY